MTDGAARTRVASRWVLAALVLLAIGLVAGLVQQRLPFSPYDEYVYYDYLTKVPTQGLVATGEEVGPEARAELECRGVAGYGPYGDGCDVGDTDDDELFPYVGLTGADIYAPVYFGVTWVLAQPLTWFGVGLLDAGRLVGGLWLAASSALLFGAMRRLGVAIAPATGLVVLSLATPVVQSAFGFLSTDAAAITAGAALAYVTARVVTGGASAWWLLPVGVLGVLAKVQAIGALGAALLVVVVHELLVRGRWRERGAWLRTVLPAAATAVAAIAAQLVWSAYRATRAVGEGADLGVGSDQLPPDQLLRQTTNVLLHVGATQRIEATAAATVAVAAATALACAGVVAGIVGLARRASTGVAAAALPEGTGAPAPAEASPAAVAATGERGSGAVDETGIARSWAIGTGALAILMIPVLSLMTFVIEDSTFEPPLRYGAALLPMLLVAAGLLLARSRVLGWLLAAGAAVVVVLAWT